MVCPLEGWSHLIFRAASAWRSVTDGTQGLPLSLGLWLPIHNLPALLLIRWFMPGLACPSAEVSLPLAAWVLPDALFPRVMLAHTR